MKIEEADGVITFTLSNNEELHFNISSDGSAFIGDIMAHDSASKREKHAILDYIEMKKREDYRCQNCKGEALIRYGKKMKKQGPVQQYQCKLCGHVCTEDKLKQ